ncbi:MAG: neutral/alkaline non-lysosomal ceramidase N-terminal domain-containing protein [Armatimonadetes bacterium]|nr:neutral/alkaline non-lysosomal ceramidase N-terminal domain-containing protein [Armatimonadota bacterium]
MQAGYAKIEVTPPAGVELCGYGFYLKRTAKGAHDPLYARAVALEAEGRKALFISADLLGFSDTMAGAVKSALSEDPGIEPEAVMLHCTHTHSGPAPLLLRGCGVMDEEYVKALASKLIEAGRTALKGMVPVERMAYAAPECAGIAYNRTYGESGPVDIAARALFIYRKEGAPLAVVNYACHPVANGVNDRASADYPGQVLDRLAEKGFEGLFLTGFCGDIDPSGPRSYDAIAAHGQKIADAVLAAEKEAEPVGETISSGIREIALPLDVPSESARMERLAAAVAAFDKDPTDRYAAYNLSASAAAVLEPLKPDFRDSMKTYVQAILVDKTAFIAFPGEVFTAFGDRLRAEFSGLDIVTVNTANGVIGYIPTADEFDREGYASHLSATLYGVFRFHKGFGERICDEAVRLVRQVAS